VQEAGIAKLIYDSIINKAPLTARTNRIIGGDAPSEYLARIEVDGADAEEVDRRLRSHLVDSSLLRNDDFEAAFRKRRDELVVLIEKAIGKPVIITEGESDGAFNEDPTEIEDLGADAL